jgi:hypothetical protein
MGYPLDDGAKGRDSHSPNYRELRPLESPPQHQMLAIFMWVELSQRARQRHGIFVPVVPLILSQCTTAGYSTANDGQFPYVLNVDPRLEFCAGPDSNVLDIGGSLPVESLSISQISSPLNRR